jgi:hypothetical protein
MFNDFKNAVISNADKNQQDLLVEAKIIKKKAKHTKKSGKRMWR